MCIHISYDVLLLAVGVALKEALSPEFKIYQKQVIDNAKTLCTALQKKGFTVVSGTVFYLILHGDITGFYF